ncbi:MAG: serine/threonine protein kinase, partial [Deltaproteobacteria bacterium]|nr:serine/threonine protein kinase [Deltaproteobacteria bacterium]
MLPDPGALVGGKYRIVRRLGEGGMGTVFEAVHEHLGSRFALKFLNPDLARRPGVVARFLQEARLSATIRSPHVTQVIDVDQSEEGDPYFVMELLEGESLERLLTREGRLPLPLAIDLSIQILAALEAAHAHGVVHRDLKPDNVWLVSVPGGLHVKLLDFGVAKLRRDGEALAVATRPGALMGTPEYMAPEQAISADQVDARADLFSFGVIFQRMITGSRPFVQTDPREVLEVLLRGAVTPLAVRAPELPPDLARLADL